ncbi:hypothetical protein F5B19DRAFT_468681 [Rostrohypoxylon terebratum]|nr:hypothetical protein F5B19DRAFT_468681 [Rostrohypoxylon terebratum]
MLMRTFLEGQYSFFIYVGPFCKGKPSSTTPHSSLSLFLVFQGVSENTPTKTKTTQTSSMLICQILYTRAQANMHGLKKARLRYQATEAFDQRGYRPVREVLYEQEKDGEPCLIIVFKSVGALSLESELHRMKVNIYRDRWYGLRKFHIDTMGHRRPESRKCFVGREGEDIEESPRHRWIAETY